MAIFPNAFFTLFRKLQKHFQFLALARLRESSQPSKKTNRAFILQHPILKYSWKKLLFKPQQHLPPWHFVSSSLPHPCTHTSMVHEILTVLMQKLGRGLFCGIYRSCMNEHWKPWTWGSGVVRAVEEGKSQPQPRVPPLMPGQMDLVRLQLQPLPVTEPSQSLPAFPAEIGKFGRGKVEPKCLGSGRLQPGQCPDVWETGGEMKPSWSQRCTRSFSRRQAGKMNKRHKMKGSK